jgi:hypothetical protein
MIRVNIWPYRGKDVAYGHASIQIDGGDPAGPLYISWWPQGAGRVYKKRGLNLYCVASIPDRAFDDDVAGEDGNPPKVITIDGGSSTVIGLDETAMKKWWLDLVRGGSTQWCTLDTNCSTISSWVLYQGGGDDFSDSYFACHNLVWTPNDVAIYAASIVRGILEARSGPPPGADGSGDAGLPGGT